MRSSLLAGRGGFTRAMVFVGGFLYGMPALAESYPIRCSREQTTCEVDTRRLTRGDRVGIFNDDGQVIAVGTVTGLRDRFRTVRITKRFGAILRDHRLQLIKDSEAENPLKYFTTVKGESPRLLGASLGLTDVGVGDSFMAMDFEAVGEFRWSPHNYFFGKFIYLSGQGKASKTALEVADANIKVSAYGLLGGASFTLMPTHVISFRGEVGIGFASVSLSTDADADEQELVEGRVSSGTGFMARLEADAVYQMGSFKPYAGLNFLRLQNSNNYGVAFGVLFDF